MCCTWLAENTGRKYDAKKSPSGHHPTTLSSQLRHVSTFGKELVSSNISYTCAHNIVNFGPLAAEIVSGVWGTPATFNGFHVLAASERYCTACSSGRQPNFAVLNRGCHLCSAGRPSRWALAHILVLSSSFFISSPNLSGRRLDVYHTSTRGVALVRI